MQPVAENPMLTSEIAILTRNLSPHFATFAPIIARRRMGLDPRLCGVRGWRPFKTELLFT